METKKYIPPKSETNNICCVRCKCWMYVGHAKKIGNKYICLECLKKEDKNDNKGNIWK